MTRKVRRTADQIRVHKLADDVASLPLSLLNEFGARMQIASPAEAAYLVNALRNPIPTAVQEEPSLFDKPSVDVTSAARPTLLESRSPSPEEATSGGPLQGATASGMERRR